VSAAARAVVVALLAATAARADSHEDRERAEAHDRDAARPSDAETLYAMGAILGSRVTTYHLSPKELERVKRGFADAAAGRKLDLRDPDLEEWGPKVDTLLQSRGNPQLFREKERGRKLAEAREPSAERLPGGGVFRSLRSGTGESPKTTDRVRVKYESRTADGKVFDSSNSAEVPVDKVVRCWTLALPKMKVGGKARLVCPSSLAYGDEGRPPQVPAGGTVIFDVELLSIAK
jgi:FKBP-type peptidyl-prolyl cis-trans isomerase FkpA